MNFKAFTYQPESGETPESVPFIKLLAYSLYTKDLKTETIDSPVIELIDNALININDKVAILEQKNSNLESHVSVLDGTILDLQNQISTLENRLNRLIGNFMVPF